MADPVTAVGARAVEGGTMVTMRDRQINAGYDSR